MAFSTGSQGKIACLTLLGLVALSQTQPLNFAMPQFEVDLLEATERMEDNYTGFVFGFNNATVSHYDPCSDLILSF